MALSGLDARENFGAMVQPRFPQNIHHGAGCSGFLVPRTKYHPRDAGEHDCPGTHRARFKRHHERAVSEPPTIAAIAVSSVASGATVATGEVAGIGCECACSFTDRYDFGVPGRIAVAFADVMAAGNDSPVRTHDDRADGDVVVLGGCAGFFEGGPHPCVGPVGWFDRHVHNGKP